MRWVLLLLAFSSAAADEHIVLKPKGTGQQKMLVFIPGGKVPNHHYQLTGQAIQDAMSEQGINLWVVIPTVFQNLCIISCSTTFLCAPLHNTVKGAVSQAEAQGWISNSSETWLAGHSLGATCANILFQAYSSAYSGLIVMGGYVDETGDHDLLHYPVPVLTLNVELDGGLARPGKISTWWRQYLTLDKSAVRTKPVIVLPKLNHSDFCPGFNVPEDLPAEVSQEEATRLIAKSVAAFLTLHFHAAGETEALKVLESQVEWTRQLMTPYLKAQSWERDAENRSVSMEGASALCALAQRKLAPLEPEEEQRLQVLDGFHVSSPNLEHCHPNWTALAGDQLLVRSCSHTNYYTDISNTGKFTAAKEVGCKLLAASRIAQQLKTTAKQEHVPCSEMNKVAVQLAEELASPSTLARYKAQGRKWCFLPDTFSVAGPVWVFHDELQLKENASCMSVQSPAMLTELNALLYPGIHYCKLLSPARVLDWMMTDSLKGHAAEVLVI